PVRGLPEPAAATGDLPGHAPEQPARPAGQEHKVGGGRALSRLPGGPGRAGPRTARGDRGARPQPGGAGDGLFGALRSPLRRRGGEQMSRRTWGAAVCGLFLLAAPAAARTITLTSADCDQMAFLSAKAPRLGWAGILAAKDAYNAEAQVQLYPDMAILMR